MDLLGVWLKIPVFSLVAVATTEGQDATKETENCWQSLDQRTACCNDEWTCWDAVFTKDECCSNGWAWRFPPKVFEPLNFLAAFEWVHGSSTFMRLRQNHPSTETRQLQWEKDMEKATRQMHRNIHQHDVQIRYFKTAEDITTNELSVYSSTADPYAFTKLSPSELPIFLDIGANIGLVSITLAKLWPSARIVALEPAPSSFRYLLWNLRENNVTSQVWPLNLALGGPSSTMIRMSTAVAGSVWTRQVPKTLHSEAHSDYIFDIPAISLGEILGSLGLGNNIDLLKLDCEGCEWEVLAQWDRLGHLFREVSIELHNGSMTEVTEDTRRHLEEKLLSDLCLHMDTEDVPRCRSYG